MCICSFSGKYGPRFSKIQTYSYILRELLNTPSKKDCPSNLKRVSPVFKIINRKSKMRVDTLMSRGVLLTFIAPVACDCRLAEASLCLMGFDRCPYIFVLQTTLYDAIFNILAMVRGWEPLSLEPGALLGYATATREYGYYSESSSDEQTELDPLGHRRDPASGKQKKIPVDYQARLSGEITGFKHAKRAAPRRGARDVARTTS